MILRPTPEAHLYSGRAVSPAGAPLGDYQIQFEARVRNGEGTIPLQLQEHVFTSADGLFTFGFAAEPPPGEIQIRLTKFLPDRSQLERAELNLHRTHPGARFGLGDVEFRSPRPFVGGIVTNTQGVPIHLARVHLRSNDPDGTNESVRSFETQSDGTFAFYELDDFRMGLPQRPTHHGQLTLHIERGKFVSQAVSVPAEGESHFKIVLTAR